MKARALIAEFIGTFSLIFIGVMAISQLADLKANGGLLGIALAHGLAIACLASATGAISGGHLNPAVTFGLMLARKIDPVNALGYILSQCLGAVAAGFSAVYVSLPGANDVALAGI